MPPLSTLLLTEKEIRPLLSPEEYLAIAEATFRSHGEGKVILPSKLYLDLPQLTGDFRAMPAFLDSPLRCGIKWVNAHPRNSRRGIPSVMAIIILNDPRTGFPLAILDGTTITKMRTGATAAVAAKVLARRNCRTVGLVGCGVQAETQLLFLSKVFPIKQVRFWGLTPSNRNRFYQNMKRLRLPLEAKKTIHETVQGADLVVTSTPSRRPLIRREWIVPGTHINAIGADAAGKRELPSDLLKMARIFVDDRHQAAESGEINVPIARGEIHPKQIKGTLGEVLCGIRRGRRNEKEITLFDATGLAIQDIAVAWALFQKARQKGIGRSLRFFSWP